MSNSKVTLTQESLNIVVKAFSDIHKNFHNDKVFDSAMIMLSKQDLETILDKISKHIAPEASHATIDMTYSEWSSYSGFIGVIDSDLPTLSQDDLEVVEALIPI